MLLSRIKLINFLLLTFLLLGAFSHAFGIGFGKLTLYSYLNEPLHAEIELLATEEVDENQLYATLAAEKDFLRARLSRPFFLTKLNFSLIQKSSGTFVYVSTNEVVKQPFLDFLVELAWPKGRLVKRYTVLLDPPPANPDLRAQKPRPVYSPKTYSQQAIFPPMPKPLPEKATQPEPEFVPQIIEKLPTVPKTPVVKSLETPADSQAPPPAQAQLPEALIKRLTEAFTESADQENKRPAIDPEMLDLFEEPGLTAKDPKQTPRVDELKAKLKKEMEALEPAGTKVELPSQTITLPKFKRPTQESSGTKEKTASFFKLKLTQAQADLLKFVLHLLVGAGLLSGAILVIFKTYKQRRLKRYLEQEELESKKEHLEAQTDLTDLFEVENTQESFLPETNEWFDEEQEDQSMGLNKNAIKASLEDSQAVLRDIHGASKPKVEPELKPEVTPKLTREAQKTQLNPTPEEIDITPFFAKMTIAKNYLAIGDKASALEVLKALENNATEAQKEQIDKIVKDYQL